MKCLCKELEDSNTLTQEQDCSAQDCSAQDCSTQDYSDEECQLCHGVKILCPDCWESQIACKCCGF